MSNDNDKTGPKPAETTFKVDVSFTETVLVQGSITAASEEEAREKTEEFFEEAPDMEILSLVPMTEEEVRELEQAIEQAGVPQAPMIH